MRTIDLVVALVLAAAVLSGLARTIGVHYAIVLVLGGLALGFVPGVPQARVEPDVVLFVFLPPLIYAAAFGFSPQDLREHAASIGALAVGLVLATVFGVAAIAHAAAGIAWGPAIVLGAILGPTDPVAATSVLRRLGAPERMATILEGEALVNDGTGLTLYLIAVDAVVTGHVSISSGLLRFVELSAGGVGIGLVAGWVTTEVRRRIDDAPIEIGISLLTAYLAYIPAERAGVSGVLAAVAAGLYAGRHTGEVHSPTSRLQLIGFWEALTFLLESVLFLLIGLQLERILGGLAGGAGGPLLDAAAVFGGMVAIRAAWMVLCAPLLGEVRPRASREELVIFGWSAMRGGLSLAAALALPLAARGSAFPDRSLLIFVAYVAIAASLVIPGLTLPPLVRALRLGGEDTVTRAQARARIALAHAALERIEDLAAHGELDEGLLEQLRGPYRRRIDRLRPQRGETDGRSAHDAQRILELRRELLAVERARLATLRRGGEISTRSARRLERDLDLEASRLSEV